MYVGTFVWFLSTLLVSKADGDCPARQADPHHEIRLHMNLSCASDNSYRPVKDLESAVDVRLRFDLKYMTFDDDKETVTVVSWVVFNWKNEFLTWNASDYGGAQEVQMESYSMWSPIFTLLNADVSVYTPGRVYTTCLIASDGAVTCVPQLTHTGLCSTALRNWPHDRRNCTLYYTSWMQTEDKVNLSFHEKDPVVFQDFQSAPGWRLLDITHARLPGQRTCCPYNDPVLTISFILKREAAGLAATVLIPSVIVVLLTCSSLLLTASLKTRLSLLCFGLFGHFVLLSQVCFLLPTFSSETPSILLFIRHSIFITLLCVWETLGIMFLIGKVSPAPGWVVSANSTLMNGPARYLVISEFGACASGEDSVPDDGRANREWTKLANCTYEFPCISLPRVLKTLPP
ncbi:nicotinic acetylcholine receptor alpha 9 subunit [Danaus plexippus plexippus]|uniref:Nicotinic acetylcholine receptor alpha 9 subunit n=1 Tax=Danaus plexippus plexippus TaxID=278856 RepID=A0A212F0R8_DANPL|nr:nicotinic acetylcholine receptor alpha 9 subunit [Danaus plexippus plexippus]